MFTDPEDAYRVSEQYAEEQAQKIAKAQNPGEEDDGDE
jgi:hypothetical protein